MPAMLRTIDMGLVYDEFEERFTMRMKAWAALFVLTAGMMSAAGLFTARLGAQNQPQPAKMDQMSGMNMDKGMAMSSIPAGPLKITFGDKSAEWTPATLAPLPHQTVTVINNHTKASETFSGVLLIDLLQRLGLPAKPEGKELRHYFVAVGSDGYEAVYSLAEVAPELHNGTVIVADSKDGKPLAGSGPLQLVTTGDKALVRCVRNLVAIRVLTVGDDAEFPPVPKKGK
jgi:hypothetical protein